MSFNLRLPNLTATTAEGKLAQMQSFLYQTVEQLNWALNTLETGGTGAVVMQGKNTATDSGGDAQRDNAVNFNELKALIIKSADIVNAYYEKIHARLAGEYVAQSDYGTFVELTEGQLKATSTDIEQLFTNLQQVITDIDNVEHTLIEVNAHIKSGLLYYNEDGIPIYGLEIGQRNEVDGVEVFNQYARFTADRLVFYDYNGREMAYISDKKLYIEHIEIAGSLVLGAFVKAVQSDGSVVKRWVGGEGQWQ